MHMSRQFDCIGDDTPANHFVAHLCGACLHHVEVQGVAAQQMPFGLHEVQGEAAWNN